METTIGEKPKGKTKISVYVDRETARRLWRERADKGLCLSHTVELALTRHFKVMDEWNDGPLPW